MKYPLAVSLLGLIILSGFAGCSKKSDSSGAGTSGGTVSDSATVTVVNGYGSGRYKVGDTVDIWSLGIPSGEVFDNWSGYSSLLENSGEWHNRFIMPAQDVTVTAALKSLSPYTLKYEKIKGVNILKNVYYYFPSGHKGIVYLLHGTGGSAQNLVNNFEWIQMMNDLVSAGYAFIVTEAEEVSLNTDLNGDGKVRWVLAPADTTTNTDYGNMRALADTFYARGYSTPSIPLYSIGMSDGGGFSAALSFIYKFAGGVSYCAPTSSVVTSTSTTPFQFCMAKYDNASEVGPAGNTTAQANSVALTSRGICSKFFMHDHSPVYPQRWARWSAISLSLSASLYNELKSNHWLDSKNYLTAVSDTIAAPSRPILPLIQ
ncbi:MAG TPA: hypothetical protein VNS58_28090 [Puia sp.]|nr:hypothetical protein [Puia sp.]